MTTSPSEPPVDVAVIGAGPAGLAAAVAAADAGLSVAVLDLGERIGGQYYRHAADQHAAVQGGPYHHGWEHFVELRGRFWTHVAAGRITHHSRTAVWSVKPHPPSAAIPAAVTVHALEGERERLPRTVRARAVVIATGAHDRHVPFPGWTLPGVMAGGGAQALLKGSGVAAGKRAVVAGTGPFLLPVADGLLAAGVEVAEVVEANAPWRMAGHPDALPAAISKLPEAVGYARRLARRRIRIGPGTRSSPHTGNSVWRPSPLPASTRTGRSSRVASDGSTVICSPSATASRHRSSCCSAPAATTRSGSTARSSSVPMLTAARPSPAYMPPARRPGSAARIWRS